MILLIRQGRQKGTEDKDMVGDNRPTFGLHFWASLSIFNGKPSAPPTSIRLAHGWWLLVLPAWSTCTNSKSVADGFLGFFRRTDTIIVVFLTLETVDDDFVVFWMMMMSYRRWKLRRRRDNAICCLASCYTNARFTAVADEHERNPLNHHHPVVIVIWRPNQIFSKRSAVDRSERLFGSNTWPLVLHVPNTWWWSYKLSVGLYNYRRRSSVTIRSEGSPFLRFALIEGKCPKIGRVEDHHHQLECDDDDDAQDITQAVGDGGHKKSAQKKEQVAPSDIWWLNSQHYQRFRQRREGRWICTKARHKRTGFGAEQGWNWETVKSTEYSSFGASHQGGERTGRTAGVTGKVGLQAWSSSSSFLSSIDRRRRWLHFTS